MMASPESLVCPTCTTSFRRAEHLRRHQLSHTAERPYRCTCCPAAFKRRDVLRKHLRTCTGRLNGGLQMPDPAAPGKKAQACDACAISKKCCDSCLPCSLCLLKGRACSYRRLRPAASNEANALQGIPAFINSSPGDTWVALAPDIDFADISAPPEYNPTSSDYLPDVEFDFNFMVDVDCPAQDEPSASHPPCFNFLFHFTRTYGLNGCFNYGRRGFNCEDNRETDFWGHMPRSLSEWTTSHKETDYIDPQMLSNTGSFDLFTGTDGFKDKTSLKQSDVANDEVPSSDSFRIPDRSDVGALCVSEESFGLEELVKWLADPMFRQTQLIWESFRPIMKRRAHIVSPESQPESDARCLAFFGPSQLRKNLNMFWNGWNPHCPIVHRPTFDPISSSYILLATMALIGGCMSNDAEEILQVKELLDVMEDLVFQQTIFNDECYDNTDENTSIQLLQAAYFVCLLQNWEGDENAKKRIRHQRFMVVVSATREMDLLRARHPWDQWSFNPSSFDWQSFCRREAMIRTFTYVYLLDTAFVIFNNSPPRMIIQEMDIDLTCPEAAFQAPTSNSCFNALTFSTNGRLLPISHLSLMEAVEILTQTTVPPDSSSLYLSMSVLNLFSVVSVYQTAIFQLQTTLCHPLAMAPIRTALRRWKFVWDIRGKELLSESHSEVWQELGFVKNAQDYFTLAFVSLNNFESGRRICGRPSTAPSRTSISSRGCLDESSMRQVIELMMSITID